MEEKKTLVEIIEEAGRADNFTCALCDAFDGNPCSIAGAPKDDCYINVACLLIDAIDREFIERPRFEDGEPVQFGDKFVSPFDSDDHETVAEIALNSEGRYSLRIGDNCGWYAYGPGKRVKRSEPEVIGADGKPIKVGETVYAVGYDRFEGPCEVTELKVGGFATVRWNDNSSGVVMASHLTHEQPDTLERIEMDADKQYDVYWGCEDVACDSCPVTIDGSKPSDYYNTFSCESAKSHDLLARQRKVFERGQR